MKFEDTACLERVEEYAASKHAFLKNSKFWHFMKAFIHDIGSYHSDICSDFQEYWHDTKDVEQQINLWADYI